MRSVPAISSQYVPSSRAVWVLLGGLAVAQCGPRDQVATPREVEPPPSVGSDSDQAATLNSPLGVEGEPGELGGWRRATEFPHAGGSAPDPDDLATLSPCPGDTALSSAATELATRQLELGVAPEAAEIAFHLRRAGSPLVWARAWSLAGPRVPADQVAPRWASMRTESGVDERWRCGIGRARRDESEVVTIVFAEVLGTLRPIPTVTRVGAWVDISATFTREPTQASLVVLGPRGRPFTALSQRRGSRLSGRVRIADRGRWLIQILADLGSGPRPALEAIVFADSVPPRTYEYAPAPGEKGVKAPPNPGRTEPDAIARELLMLLNATRSAEGLTRLESSERLNSLAQQHAVAMSKAGHIGHDVGNGGPDQRLENAQIRFSLVGENLARAADARSAHRALWSSPSHRKNLLSAAFNHVGIGLVTGNDGLLWVCEIFAQL